MVTRQQQRQIEAKLANTVADASNSADSCSKVTKAIQNDNKQEGNRVPKGFFRIDKIVDHRVEAGEKEYLVRWKGYDEKHDEWRRRTTSSLICTEPDTEIF